MDFGLSSLSTQVSNIHEWLVNFMKYLLEATVILISLSPWFCSDRKLQ